MMIPPVHTVHTLVFIQSANVVQDAITSTPPPSRAHLVLCCSAPAPIIMGHLKHERLCIYISPLQITNIYHPLQSQQLIVSNCYTVIVWTDQLQQWSPNEPILLPPQQQQSVTG